LFSTDMG